MDVSLHDLGFAPVCPWTPTIHHHALFFRHDFARTTLKLDCREIPAFHRDLIVSTTFSSGPFTPPYRTATKLLPLRAHGTQSYRRSKAYRRLIWPSSLAETSPLRIIFPSIYPITHPRACPRLICLSAPLMRDNPWRLCSYELVSSDCSTEPPCTFSTHTVPSTPD